MRLQGISFGALAAVCCFWVVSAPAPSAADTVTLKNGREIYGRLVEEQEESIRIRTSGGTITISKAEVATFSENENLEPPKKGQTAREKAGDALAEKLAKERAEREAKGKDGKGKDGKGKDGKGKDGKGKDGKGKDGKDGADEVEEWAWGEDVSDERIEELTPIRDDLLGELEKLGPTSEKRLEALELTPDELRDLKERIKTIGARTSRRRRGNIMREKALNGILETYGLKAFKRLTIALGSKNQWTKRNAARGVATLSGRGDDGEAEWLFWNYDTAGGLMALMDHQGEADSPNIRKEGFDTLAKYVNKSFGFKLSDSAISTPAESKSTRDAKKFVSNKASWWRKKQEEAAKRREEIQSDLEKVKNGEDPSGSTGDDEDPSGSTGDDEDVG